MGELDLEEEREKKTAVGADGPTRIVMARVLRERNEYKAKYFSLLEQIRYVYIRTLYILLMLPYS